jgi:transposase
MLKLPTLGELDRASSVRIFLCTLPTDMRRGFDRLAEMVRSSLGQDPLAGSLFVFRSRGSNRLKILYWDKDGFALWYKRLEQGTFRFPRTVEGTASVEVKASELAMLLEGIDLKSIKRSPRLQMKNN